MEKREPILIAYGLVSNAWTLSELVVLMLNRRRRALHDFIAGTVVIRTRLSISEQRLDAFD
jgi:uncharacterized RDD family membrane protein YckC